jgi:hypothetical protein
MEKRLNLLKLTKAQATYFVAESELAKIHDNVREECRNQQESEQLGYALMLSEEGRERAKEIYQSYSDSELVKIQESEMAERKNSLENACQATTRGLCKNDLQEKANCFRQATKAKKLAHLNYETANSVAYARETRRLADFDRK